MAELQPECYEIVKHYESLHDGDLTEIGLQPKLDPLGIWTVGWGHAVVDPVTGKQLKGLDTRGRAYELFGNLTEIQAQLWLERDMNEFGKAVLRACSVTPTNHQLGAMTSFAYNLGIYSLLKSQLIRKFNSKDFEGAALEFRKWVNGGGQKMKGLVARRESEAVYFLTGKLIFYRVTPDWKIIEHA